MREIDWTRGLDLVDDDSRGGIVVDSAFHVRAISDGVLRRTGMTRPAVLDTSVLDLFQPSDIGRAAAAMGRCVPGELSKSPGVYRVLASSGTWDIYEMTVGHLGADFDDAILVEFEVAGKDARTGSVIDDTVELTQLLVEPPDLRESLREISDFAERNVDRLVMSITIFAETGNPATFCQHDLDESIVAMNAAAHPLSLPAHVLEAYSLAKIRTWSPDSEVGTITPDSPDTMTMVILDSDQNLLGYVDAYRAVVKPPTEDEWRVYRLVSQVLRAVMLHAQLVGRLEYLGFNDALTGVANRHHLLELMGAADLKDTGVLAINLDGFRWVNENLGFEAGDRVLGSVAASILAGVPASAVVARLASDEFLVWLPKITDTTAVFRIAEQLRKAITVPLDNADRRSRTRCSIGATQAVRGENPDGAIHRAVAAMADSKSSGGDRVTHR